MGKTKIVLNRAGVRELMQSTRNAGNPCGTCEQDSQCIRCRSICSTNASGCKGMRR